MEKEKVSTQNIENEDISPIFNGIPIQLETKDEWRKVRYSCSGAGRIPANFDTWHLTYMRND